MIVDSSLCMGGLQDIMPVWRTRISQPYGAVETRLIGDLL